MIYLAVFLSFEESCGTIGNPSGIIRLYGASMETIQLLKRTPTEDLRNHIYYGYLLLFQRQHSSKLWELTVGQNLTAPCFVPLSIIITT